MYPDDKDNPGDLEADVFEECFLCAGTGRLNEHRCPTCSGHGTILVEPEEDDEDHEQ
jgi:DnaJ-class molecular chaperone